MEDTIRAIIGEDHSHICTSASLGRTGENFITLLEITLPEKLCDYWPYLDFEKPDGETMRTPRLDINDCKITYDVPLALLDEDGYLEIQVVLQKESGEIWKSHPKKYVVFKSIDAVDDIPEKEDFITEAQKLVDALNQEVAEIAETLANNAEFVDSVILAMETPTQVSIYPFSS